jgi:predicted metal-dependent HD superfamily phosphohydrolase
MDLAGVKAYIVKRFTEELDPRLSYHNLEHTLDVYEAVRRINHTEKIAKPFDSYLEAAALLHDAGMLVTYQGHEAASAEIAYSILKKFGFVDDAVNLIAELILVTRLPQSPAGLFDQVLCDADLDYLGRADYMVGAFKLRMEWEVLGIRKMKLTEWFELQISFLREHEYFTNASKMLRNERKRLNLTEILQLNGHH